MSNRARPTTATAIRFDPAIHEALVKASDDHNVPMNWLVNRAVADFLSRLLPASEVIWTRQEPGT